MWSVLNFLMTFRSHSPLAKQILEPLTPNWLVPLAGLPPELPPLFPLLALVVVAGLEEVVVLAGALVVVGSGSLVDVSTRALTEAVGVCELVAIVLGRTLQRLVSRLRFTACATSTWRLA